MPRTSFGYSQAMCPAFADGAGAVLCRKSDTDAETGLGRWTEDQFVRTFKHGVTSGHQVSNLAVEWSIYADIKEEDVRALCRYRWTIKSDYRTKSPRTCRRSSACRAELQI